MIQEFVSKFMAGKQELAEKYYDNPPGSYEQVVRDVVALVGGDDEYGLPDPKRIHVIDDGDYQGTYLFIIGAGGYQPSTYWSVFVHYGSCSGCDSLQAALYDDDDKDEITRQVMLLALHIVQEMKEI